MSNSPLTIRPATKEDVDTVVRLINAGGPDGRQRRNLPDILPAGFHEAFQTIDSDVNQHLLIAELDGQIVGTFQIAYLTYLSGENRPDAQIEAIHVKAEYRGKGIGTEMLRWVIEESKKRHCRRIQLTSDKLRTEAHDFYRRMGFCISHEGMKLYL